MKKINLFILILILFLPFNLRGQSCRLPPPPGPPGGDNADDNFSHSSGYPNNFYFVTPDLLIYKNGYYESYDNQEFSKNENAFTDLKNGYRELFDISKTLILPTGSLYGAEHNKSLKFTIQEHVKLGGTIVVFAQQYGSHIDNVIPVPEGEQLKSYGWREDQSCARDSSFSESMHPVLSSLMKQRADVGVDGYFERYPSTSTVLLRKNVNDAPSLLYYPYGNGTVILTSMFTDWAHAHSQATQVELDLARDIISFAKNPKLPIPLYNVVLNPNPTISNAATIKNTTEHTVTKVKITIQNPSRTTIIHEFEKSVALEPGGEIEIPFSFTHPGANDNSLRRMSSLFRISRVWKLDYGWNLCYNSLIKGSLSKEEKGKSDFLIQNIPHS